MRSKIVFTVLGVLLSCGGLTQAQLVTVGMSAQVTQVTDLGNLFQGNIAAGNTITGYYTYDLASPDLDADPTVGHYNFTASNTGISLSVKGYTFQTDSSNADCYIDIGNNYYGTDAYAFRSFANMPISGRDVQIGWSISDSSQTLLSNDALPSAVPILSQWTGAQTFDIAGWTEDGMGNFTINAQILGFTPEPASIFLIGLGAMLVRKRIA